MSSKQRILPFIVSVMMLFAIILTNAGVVYAVDINETISETEVSTPFTLGSGETGALGLNTAKRHIICTDLSDAGQAYYTGDDSFSNLITLSGAADASDSYAVTQNNPLYDALHNLMRTTLNESKIPVYSGYRDGSLAYYWSMTDTGSDLDSSKSSHFLMFYSDAKYEYPGNTVSMNREHIWPKSHASFHEMNGGSDLHHLRPSVSTVNMAKSDHPFGYVDEIYASGYDTGTLNGDEVYKVYPDKDVFEPKDDVKGDVARILLYVYCCWGQPNLYSDVAGESLPEGDVDEKTNTGGRVITDLDTLLTWCEDDPVDIWEMQRNDLTQQVQGNRNVFIDYPELAWKLFGREIPKGIQTPTRKGCSHKWGASSIQVSSCTQPGTKRDTCEICGNVHTVPIPAQGHMDEDHDNTCDRCDTELLGTYTMTERIADGDHLLIYHPDSGKAITPLVNSSNRLNGITAIEKDGAIVPSQDTSIFHAESAGDSAFCLVHNGKYLAMPQRGGSLFWSDTKEDCAVWKFVSNGDGSF